VQRNIAAFGGDPNNVALAGESAGGGAVLALLTSPLANGLFQRAILESPGIPTPRAGAAKMRSLEAAESIAMDYARTVGINGGDASVLAGLRALSTEELTKGIDGYAMAIFDGPEIPGLSHSIIDGRLVVEDPESALRAGRQAMVPIITGANNRDMAVSPARTKNALFAKFGSLSPEARTLYDPTGNASFEDVLQGVCADFAMLEPSRNLAEWTAKAGQPAYFYRFSYVPVALRQQLPGAPHALEIVFAFDGVDVFFKEQATDEDKAMAQMMSGYWVDFVKTGNPNGGGRPAWPRYDPASRDVLNFTDAGVIYGPDPVKERLDLWQAVWERGALTPQ
jgi:para-nitrobenzyl esterase